MSETPNRISANAAEPGASQVDALDLLIVLAKHKKLVIGLPLLAGVIAVGVALVMSPVYRSGTTLLPP